jgi:hypothetical protein
VRGGTDAQTYKDIPRPRLAVAPAEPSAIAGASLYIYSGTGSRIGNYDLIPMHFDANSTKKEHPTATVFELATGPTGTSA